MIMKYQEQVLGMVEASGVASDPKTTEMVMAQAAEEVANANAAMGVAQSPEQQMLLLEKERLEFDREKAQAETLKDSAEIALKQRDMNLREKENMSDLVMNVGKMETEERRDNLKALESAAKLELERDKAEDNSEIKAADTAMKSLLAMAQKGVEAMADSLITQRQRNRNLPSYLAKTPPEQRNNKSLFTGRGRTRPRGYPA